ncbi:CD276 antigen-like [Huso huso]|uniref:CD276 antigen-like n=1 Tax=Huso huso TaxID=61971 RepID=A0ABR0YP08_HUSHU
MKDSLRFTHMIYVSLLVLKSSSSIEFEVRVPSTPQVALHGRYAVLECRFTVEGDLNLDKSVLTWQRGSEIVHSFYYAQDQLEKQSPRYWNRTSLYLSELKRGNASLKLEGVGPEDAGEYTCSVSTLLGSQRKTLSLIFAALYTEPLLRIKVNPHNVTSSLQSEGYPDSTVQWLDGEGQDVSILSQTVSQRNAEGLYTVTSTLSTVRSSNTTLTFILKNRELNQHITRTFSLLPEDAPVDDNPAGMRWAPVLSVIVLAVLCVLALTIYSKTCKKTTAKSIEHLENGKLMSS